MVNLSPEYWDQRYLLGQTIWDVGTISEPLKQYIDQLENKRLKILVPGAGSGHEIAYLFQNGFSNSFFLDYSQKSIEKFKKRLPGFPKSQIIFEDFFEHCGQYDLLVEQTFFSSIQTSSRKDYVKKCFDLLKPGGKLVGLLFGHHFPFKEPPYGGTEEEYRQLFLPFFDLEIFETANNSIKPRKGRELFIKFRKKRL